MQAAQRYLAAVKTQRSNNEGVGSRKSDEVSIFKKTKASQHSQKAPDHEKLGKSETSLVSKDSARSSHNRSFQSFASTSDETDSNAEAEPSYMQALRRGSLSRVESQSRLRETLSKYNDYVDPHEDSRMQQMKDTIQNSIHGRVPKPQQRFGRRASLTSSSCGSSHRRLSSDGDSGNTRSNDSSHSHLGSVHRRGSTCSTVSLDVPTSLPRRAASGGLLESTTSDQANPQRHDLSFSMSAATLPANNIPQTEEAKRLQNESKRDQIVESLVWFSFHTPRAVLEDLIKHELDLWKQQCNRGKRQVEFGKSLLSPVEDNDSDHSLSSLSEEGQQLAAQEQACVGNFSKAIEDIQQSNLKSDMILLPKAVERESALLFVDMSGFTRLSTMLDVESLSRVINSYFDMILSEVILHGGDILKFAGDAFFAEWKVLKIDEDEDDDIVSRDSKAGNPLAELNASLASMNDMMWDDDDFDVPKLSTCVLAAAKCATAIVDKFSDYQVSQPGAPEAMLNVHCGIGVGNLVGLHVSDYKESQEELGEETRREFLIVGEAIDQVSRAADVATDGQVMASPEAMLNLAFCCDVPEKQRLASEPVCIASRREAYLKFDSSAQVAIPSALQPYESLRVHCKTLSPRALARLHLQMALYVHPVIRANELSMSAAIQAGKISKPTEALESRHREEAELRSVYTLFIMPILSPRITGRDEVDQVLYQNLADIMNVTCRELDRYSGHLRQFIVDDKGVVLLATFGLRGSTFPNMVASNALPATFAIHNALKNELSVESRIGGTFGKVYCGTVGGLRRHEFAVMGAPVNLAARLMSSKVNRGILVDEAVKEQAGNGFAFRSLPPVTAKGYDKPVPILEPLHAVNSSKKKKSSYPFVGRQQERMKILSLASALASGDSQRAMVFLMGESGMGKTALSSVAMDQIKQKCAIESQLIVSAKAVSTETEQRNPLSTFRKILLSVIRDLCNRDGTCEQSVDGSILSRQSGSFHGMQLKSLRSLYAKTSMSFRQKPPMHGALNELGADKRKSFAFMKYSDESTLPGTLSKRNSGLFASQRGRDQLSMSLHCQKQKRTKGDSLSTSLHRINRESTSREFKPSSLHRSGQVAAKPLIEDETETSHESDPGKGSDQVPYFEKICWVCEKLDYPFEYADIVGSQFLALDGASPVTHVDGHVPSMDELVEFLVDAFICFTEYADITVISLDNFQWVDSFSWKIFKELGERGERLLLVGAMRSHDKQALRRLSTAAASNTKHLGQITEITLSSLDTEDIRSLASHILGFSKDDIPDSICSDIFQRSGGLPVFVVQVLENVKRAKTLVIENGEVQWTPEGLKEKRATGANNEGAVMEETFLSRFDGLHAQVRKVLQTCAVLGQAFSLTEVLHVHPEMEGSDIEQALSTAAEEMIIVEQESEDEERPSDYDDSTGILLGQSSQALDETIVRKYEFSHALWRKSVLTTMLKERKIELHRLIAESMEKHQNGGLEESDISRLLTLFDQWKSCGDFSKSAPLAVAIGSRLEEWDLFAQSLELYMDALDMSFDSVETHEGMESMSEEWIQVSASPQILDSILRLHIRIGLCHQRLGDDCESIATFEDAHKILQSTNRLPSESSALKMPIISSLCVLQLEQEAHTEAARSVQRDLLHGFVEEATREGNPVHIGRANSLQAMYYARHGQLALAIDAVKTLQGQYDIKDHSFDMVAEYGRDFALECLSESVQWIYLLDQHGEAEERADLVLSEYLSVIDQSDGESMMAVLLPILQVFKLCGRAKDAEWLLKRYIINPAHDQGFHCDFWVPLFNPLAYLLEVIVMEESDNCDNDVLDEMCVWVLEEENTANFDVDLETKAHTLIGELCWRLASYKELVSGGSDSDSDSNESDTMHDQLKATARRLLTPVAQSTQGEVFLKNTALALLEAL